jgi:hypothetical protein
LTTSFVNFFDGETMPDAPIPVLGDHRVTRDSNGKRNTTKTAQYQQDIQCQAPMARTACSAAALSWAGKLSRTTTSPDVSFKNAGPAARQ